MRTTFIVLLSACLYLAVTTISDGASLKRIAKDPYVGAIVMDCSTGKVIFEDKADVPAYPASILKIMDLLMVVEYVEQGKTTLSEKIRTTAEASTTGGSQVYLKEHEEFILDDMLYALMIQSANDVAVALAIHYAGSKDAFIKLMNERAAKLGMRDTRFRSVHGLPPSKGGKPDVTTARDMARLGMEVVKHPLALKYTSVRERGFRNNKFQMRTHNHLLGAVEGCDGLKTGWIRAAGYSSIVTVERDGRRIVLAILGSAGKTIRDTKAKELIADAFLNLPSLAAPQPVLAVPAEELENEEADTPRKPINRALLWRGGLVALSVLILVGVSRFLMKKKFQKYDFY